jgi:mono/diheme cytochrome c family protein
MRALLVTTAGFALTATTVVLSQTATVRQGPYSEAQAYRGEKVADTLCSGCHGAGLSGGDSGPKLVGDKFLGDWNGKSLAELFDWIFEEMPEDAPGTLKKEDVASVVAYILQLNRVPPGKQDLPLDREALSRLPIGPNR